MQTKPANPSTIKRSEKRLRRPVRLPSSRTVVVTEHKSGLAVTGSCCKQRERDLVDLHLMAPRGLCVGKYRAVRSFDPATHKRDPTSCEIGVVPSHRQKLRTPYASRYRHGDEEVQQLVALSEPSNQRRDLIGRRGLPVSLADLDPVRSLDRVIEHPSPPLRL